MKTFNQYMTPSSQAAWEETPEGFLRCPARVLRSCIMPYSLEELKGIPNLPENCPDPVMMLVPMDSMVDPESLRSLEGVPIVDWDHMWATPENVQSITKGNTAGAPRIVGPYAETDILVTNPRTIEDIKNKKIGEISAAYFSDTVFEPGEYDGQHFDAKQTKIRYNHIAVIPEGCGRAGLGIRILNKEKKGDESNMDKIISVKVKLRNGRFVNTDDEGAEAIAAQNAADDAADKKVAADGAAEKGTSGKKLEDSMSELEELKAAKAESDSQIEELKGELSVYKEKIDSLLSEETIEGAANDMNEESGEAGEILENCPVIHNEKGEEEKDDAKKEEIKNSIKKLHGTKLHSAVLSAIGFKSANMSSEALRGAFKAQHQIMKVQSVNGITVKRAVAGAKVFNIAGQKLETTGAPVQRTARERLGFAKKA